MMGARSTDEVDRNDHRWKSIDFDVNITFCFSITIEGPAPF